MVVSYPEDSTTVSISSGSDTLSTPFSAVFLEPQGGWGAGGGGGYNNVLFRAEHSIVIYSQYSEQPRVSAFLIVYFKEKLCVQG